MEGLLTAVHTKRVEDISTPAETCGISLVDEATSSAKAITHSSPEALLQLLQQDPSEQELYQILKRLDPTLKDKKTATLDLRQVHPVNGQILQVLLKKTIPDHWRNVERSSSKIRGTLLRCFFSIVGLRGLVGYLQVLINAIRSSVKGNETGNKLALTDVLSFTATLLKPTDFVFRIYKDNGIVYNTSTKRRVAWSEFCSLLSGGKLLSTVAESLSLIGDTKEIKAKTWIGQGNLFAEWLGKNLSYMVIQGNTSNEDPLKCASLMTGRALGLGYTDQFVRELYAGVIVDSAVSLFWSPFLQHLRQHDKNNIFQSILKHVQRLYFPSDEKKIDDTTSVVGGVAALLAELLLRGTDNFQENLKYWLSPTNHNVVTTFGLRRALVLLVSNETDSLRDLLSQSFRDFGDSFNIKHSMLQSQEGRRDVLEDHMTSVNILLANAQVLLMAAGYLHRFQPVELHSVGRSTLYLNAVSNRLAASSTRARLLGMVVGMAVSSLVEPTGKALTFDLEEFGTEDAEWYLRLTCVSDRLTSIKSLHDFSLEKGNDKGRGTGLKVRVGQVQQPAPATRQRESSKIVDIQELSDDTDLDMEENEFIPYAKPDSDASDSEEDPTLIQRVKPTAPVYLRDLIACLKDNENVDRYHLGVINASTLIRKKAGFGTELIENIDSLALVILSLQNNYSLTSFHEHRLQAMIALLVAQPVRMGRFFTTTFFDGDLSQTQRSAILTAIGLGARELAGFGEEDSKSMGLPSSPRAVDFPSKKLPAHLQHFYETKGDESPVSTLTEKLAHTSLQPLALDAADAASGPNALKVRTFSSRMEVERQRRQRETQMKKKSPSQNLHKDLTEGFFNPLVGRFAAMMQSRSLSSNGYNPFHSPNILRLFIQTVTLVISTLGPHTPALPTITKETLNLIIALHGTAVSTEPIVLLAILSLFLAMIDLNVAAGSSAEERLITEHGSHVIELRDWTNEIFERMPATVNKMQSTEKADDVAQTRILAAGILVKLGEVIERYQGRLMGINIGFKY